ncbi:MAG TPA: hypothetical protein VKE96_18065 [Vicinamibacterales bacterium]|nr:hypothetical protein [Vicinamibacterales bacterium]
MTANTVAAFCLGAAVATASAIVAGQPTTPYPGQMTEARVKIDNRGSSESVPVDVQAINVREPLRVEVINGDASHPTVPPVLVRSARATWEYATTTVPAGQDAVAALNARGAQGWELMGVTLPATGGMTFILKRMR